MNKVSILEQTDEQIMEEVRKLRVGYKLKQTHRYSSPRDSSVHTESVAEHIFALFYLAEYFLPLEDPLGKYDIAKLNRIFVFHDFPEIVHGDLPYHMKTKEFEDREHAVAKDAFQMLPSSLSDAAYEAWNDYETHNGPEARFAYALDKVEPVFELQDPVNEKSMKRLKFTYEQHIERKMNATRDFPYLRKFVEVASRDMQRRNVFWEKEAKKTT